MPASLLLPPIVLLAGGTLFFAAYALGLIELTNLPGKDPAGSDMALLAALLGMLTGAGVAFLLGSMAAGRLPLVRNGWLLDAALAPLAVAFLFARHYTYYFPSLRRIGEVGIPSFEWLLVLGVGALVAAYLTRTSPVYGYVLTSGVLFLALATVVLQLGGH